jgi:hypothetical protein
MELLGICRVGVGAFAEITSFFLGPRASGSGFYQSGGEMRYELLVHLVKFMEVVAKL